ITPDQKNAIGHILRGGRHLLELINEVLDISRIEAGKLSLSPEPVELDSALHEPLELVRPLAQERDVRLNGASASGLYVRADRHRLKQVLINLISNAIKYNRNGGSVTLSSEKVEDRVRISIVDTGIGIPAERQSQLFIPFERLGAELSTVEGTGLGLALSQRLVEAMDGTISVSSVAGQGSTFSIELPLALAPIENAGLIDPAQESNAAGPLEPRTVLYVEDNFSNLKLVERVLNHRPSINLITAMDGASGLAMAAEHGPDLILLDVNLPDMDGHEVLVRLRADTRSANVPVIVLSADATRGQMDRLMQRGAIDYLTKPLELKRFLAVIDQTLAPAKSK
ncbi:MAG: response regulator, partial [Verrucomicrobiaceae bacterium]|nr:response regulator [Verrucomicrobiaceae bacterium]